MGRGANPANGGSSPAHIFHRCSPCPRPFQGSQLPVLPQSEPGPLPRLPLPPLSCLPPLRSIGECYVLSRSCPDDQESLLGPGRMPHPDSQLATLGTRAPPCGLLGWNGDGMGSRGSYHGRLGIRLQGLNDLLWPDSLRKPALSN